MLKSMTGYGKAEISTPYGRLVIEIQSVNRKFFETTIFLPKELSSFEISIKKWLAEKLFRGNVTLKAFFYPDKVSAFMPNVLFLKKLKKEWIEVVKDIGLDEKDIDLPFLLHQARFFSSFEEDKEEKQLTFLKKAVDLAIKDLIIMKDKEGKILLVDITKRIKKLSEYIEKIKQLAPQAEEKFAEKLKEKIISKFPEVEDNEERIAREVVIYADKVDITEEVIRFKSHVLQFEELLQSKSTTKGRKLDFILQEMNREVNTIGVKSQDSEISKKVILLKSELEKIREQVQNIE